MSRAIPSLLALLILLAAAFPVAAAEPKAAPPSADAQVVGTGEPEIIPGEVIVKWRGGALGSDVARGRGLAVIAELGVPGKGMSALVSTLGRGVNEVLADLRADPNVEYAEPNYRVQLADDGAVAAVDIDCELTGDQYSLDQMQVRDAWSRTTGGTNVIAVLDTGVQANHPDLMGRVLTGYDFVNYDTNAADDNGHGTWVAGIIAANANDAYGIAGISWTDKILPVKIMNSSGMGNTSDLTSGIIWAADRGAQVINMSVGGFPYSQYVQDAVNYAWDKGSVLVGAAGNNNREESFYPASFTNVISVSATQCNDEFSHWSSYGPAVDVSAPGSSVHTTNCIATICPNRSWGAHTYISGTSFATPNVAGVVALLRAENPTRSPQWIVDRLISTVDDLGYSGWDKRYGHGRVNAFRALGGSPAQAGRLAGDGLETNNTLAAARVIGLGVTTWPTIYPAGDVDAFAVDLPRAGRLDVRVTGVVDARTWLWRGSALPVDPIVELYDTAGTLLKRVDAVWESGTELAQVSVSGPTRILVRVLNYYASGSRTAYSITPTYVDTVAPTVTFVSPAGGATAVNRAIDPLVRFNEPVTNVTSTTLRLRDTTTNALIAATVSYDSARREARLRPSIQLAKVRTYRIEATNGIKDVAGNGLTAANGSFTTSSSAFIDTVGNRFETEIAWLASSGITSGCAENLFCPKGEVLRDQMASFLSRALELPAASRDYFADDGSNKHHANINRIAAAQITAGCSSTNFCPSGTVTRGQMASFLARAMDLPPTAIDFFADDNGNKHEGAINRVAAAGITSGCSLANSYCPDGTVTREQMAAFLYRAFRD
ncbi:hypothetical protein BH23CHL10_BH23CHL10_00760 [soil metagenome]